LESSETHAERDEFAGAGDVFDRLDRSHSDIHLVEEVDGYVGLAAATSMEVSVAFAGAGGKRAARRLKAAAGRIARPTRNRPTNPGLWAHRILAK